MPDETISHYELRSKLGQGGMGIVYRAVDTRLGRVVALKMLPREAVGRDDLRQRMLREARAAARLNHPNICALYDVDEAQGFLVMECVEGASLSDLLRRGALPFEEAVGIAVQIAAGLAEAHKHGIVHRDIKPSNVLITGAGQVKITDFGLAKSAEETSLTLTGQIMGTPAYMSPEQFRGTAVDERTDIWSFGVVLYELLTGKLPFQGNGISAVMYAVVHEAPAPLPLEGGPELARLQTIIDRCLAKAPEMRFQRMADVAAALSGFASKRIGATELTRTFRIGGGETPSVAVLDFTSEDPNLDWLGLAVAETLTADLRKVGELRVVDRQRVLKAASQHTAAGLNEALGVRWLIRGSVRQSREDVGLAAEAVDSLVGRAAAEASAQGPLEQVLSLIDRILLTLLDSLGVPVDAERRRRIERPETHALDAYRLYARGRRLFYTFDAERMEEARQTFEEAIRLDPRYGMSWVGLGTIYSFRYIRSTDPRDLQTGIGCLQQAIAVDPDLAEAHVSLSYALLRQGSFEQGIAAGIRAVELEPTNAAAHYFLGGNYVVSAAEGRRLEHFEPAMRHLGECVRLEANYQGGLMLLGWLLMLHGRHEEALRHLTHAAEVERSGRFDFVQMVGAQTLVGLAQYRTGDLSGAEQSFIRSVEYLRTKSHLYRDYFTALSHCGLADIRLEQRMQDEALDEFTAAREAVDRNAKGLGMGYALIRVLSGMARSFQKLGMAREAREHLARASGLYRSRADYNFQAVWDGCDAQACYDLARACAVMNQRDLAAQWLEEAASAGWRDQAFFSRDESVRALAEHMTATRKA